MKLWEKNYTLDQTVEKFTVGNDRELDIKLAEFDIQGTLVHAKMLESISVIDQNELIAVEEALLEILVEVKNGNFKIEEEFEDIHSKIEFELTKKVGNTGKKIHTARSRNDQVLVDLHLFVKAEIDSIKNKLKELFNVFMALSDKHKNVLMPGYTHTQVAMPSSFGLWFGAYAESLVDDVVMFNAAYKITDQNPLGSAAGYGSSYPINRKMTTKLLGFATMKYNSVAAQMARGKLEKCTAYAMASVAGTLSKFSSDVCFYMCQNFGFLSLQQEFTTGSSIMPHKKNPDVFELVRATCNKIQNLPAEIICLTNNLTTGYHRDFQLLKQSFFSALEELNNCIDACIYTLPNIQVNKTITNQKIYDNMFTVEAVNKLVQKGMPFRDAYKAIARQVAEGKYKPEKAVNHSHEGSIGNLCLKEIQEKFEAVYKK